MGSIAHQQALDESLVRWPHAAHDPDNIALANFVNIEGTNNWWRAQSAIALTLVALALANGRAGEPEPLWSLQPLQRIDLARVQQANLPDTNPIDRFILAKLAEKRLQPSPPADRRTLLRRVYFDLIGLPPTPEAVQIFLADKSAQAYEKVVDRLLASPRHGERWARHWMDVVHFAETHGHDQDRIRSNAWPYRDYLIRAFNEDRPYARFVEEQLAGDVLFPDDPQGIVALGFIAAGPWDESSLRDIKEETTDRQIGRYLDRDDMVTTAMSTFVSVTVHCARCHDHKFDPISQRDYYSLQAVFAGVDRANRAFDTDAKTNRLRQSLMQKKAALERKDKSLLASLLEPAAQAEVAAWERSVAASAVVWTPLDPDKFTSAGGTTLAKQADGSVLATGTRPETDTYTIAANTGLKGITAVRLEVLTDDSLPHKGPGRQDNGNLHLSEFHLKAGSQPITLHNPTADFNQDGWTIAHALDGKEKTAWGIYPQVGKPHAAVFELKEPISLDAGATLTFVLEQKHGGGHLIGRARLSVTTAPPPVRANPFPDDIAKILATPAAQRSETQRVELAAFHLKGELHKQLAALPPPQFVYAAASDFVPDGGLVPAKGPRPIRVLKRGDLSKPGDEALPGALGCVADLKSRFEISDADNEGLRRAALAKWITDARNPLTWRSIVNRVWQYHLGRGLVDTPNDFGRMGSTPTHPELLDWLAVWFRDRGGSLKELHRLIVTSETYRQASQIPVAADVRRLTTPGNRHQREQSLLTSATTVDADNRLLWRMNRARLDAESIRDAVLQITGQLDLTMGGPSVQQFVQSPGIHVTPVVDYAKFDVDSPASRRRSVYRFLFRTLPDPLMDSLDCPAGDQFAATRTESVTPLQALALWNNHFIVRQSEHFAARVSKLGKDLDAQIAAAYQLALGRAPTKSEAKELVAYAAKHGLANTCRVILNSNEFMFVN